MTEYEKSMKEWREKFEEWKAEGENAIEKLRHSHRIGLYLVGALAIAAILVGVLHSH